jgi:hypothetical protein
MIDKQFVKDKLVSDIDWHKGHGAFDDYLGLGMFYYTIPYVLRSKLCVCIGSGGGFVPQLMKQSQRDLGFGRTILIDSNEVDEYPDCPRWMKGSKFTSNYNDVEIMINKYENCVHYFDNYSIDYLHIDADHSFEGTYRAFEMFERKMNIHGVITLHDVGFPDDVVMPCGKMVGVPKAYRKIKKDFNWNCISFPEIGGGLAIFRYELPQTIEKTSPYYKGWRMNRQEGT